MPNKSYLKFKTTKEIKVASSLIEQVIGQEKAIDIIKKAAQQKRHLLLLGEPGTGKSMLGKALAEILNTDEAVDVLCMKNAQDDNTPLIRVARRGEGRKIIEAAQLDQFKNVRGRGGVFNIIILLVIIASSIYSYIQWKNGAISDIIYATSILITTLVIGLLLFLTALTANIGKRYPGADHINYKVLVDNSKKKIIFQDASGSHEGALLGDVLHDPFQSGGLGTPAHLRVIAGMVHKANKGVLFIDEIANLKPEMQAELLTILQEKKFPITGRSEKSAGAVVRTEPVPADFILVAAGNMETLKHMHPALRSRIRGYGYEVYMNNTIDDTEENRVKIIQFIAQEIKRDGRIPHFSAQACEAIIQQARKRADKRGKLTTRFRELGGIVRAAGDIAKVAGKNLVTEKHVDTALKKFSSIEQQAVEEFVNIKKRYNVFKNEGIQIGRVNGLAVLGAFPPYHGMMLPIEAEVTSGGERVDFIATGQLGKIAKEAIQNISALIKKHFDEDLKKKYNVYVQFIQTHEGVEGDSASIAVATAIVSSLKKLPIKQDYAMTGSLSIRGEVLPIGGVSAKIEGAIQAGIKNVIIPESNVQDIVVDEALLKQVNIIPVKTIGEVFMHIFDKKSIDRKLSTRFKRMSTVQ